MKKRVLFVLVALGFLVPSLALAHGHHHRGHQHGSQTHQEAPRTQQATTTVPTVPTPPNSQEKTLNAYVTGYSYWDNTPAGSTDISNGVIHSKAGGTGTFSDPITLAVGHSITGGKDVLDYPAGTKFYFPFLKKYVIVEDTCGDSSTPQNGPCHTGYKGNVWIDVYIGKGASNSTADACMDKITEVHQVIQNPVSTYPVVSGDIAANCTVY